MNVDYEQLIRALQCTYSPSEELRKQAEESIKALRRVRGCVGMLLFLIMSHTAGPGNGDSKISPISRDVRLAAAISLKNIVREGWEPRGSRNTGNLLAPEDKDFGRQNFMVAIVREPDECIRKQLLECFYEVARLDYPQRWPEILKVIVGHLCEGDLMTVHNTLQALRKLVKIFEFKPCQTREPLHHILEHVYSILQGIMEKSIPVESVEAAMLVTAILKIMWSATQYCLPLTPSGPVIDLGSWLRVLCQVLAMPVVPEPPPNMDNQEAAKWPPWKVKKWAFQIVARYVLRFGNPNLAKDSTLEFAKTFSSQYSPIMIKEVLNVLALRPGGKFCPDAVLIPGLTYMSNAIELSSTYRIIKPHIFDILTKVVFPLLCPTDEDIELFQDEPRCLFKVSFQTRYSSTPVLYILSRALSLSRALLFCVIYNVSSCQNYLDPTAAATCHDTTIAP
eukprot:500875_1